MQCLDSIDDFILTLQQCRHEKVLGNAQTSHLHVCKWGLETHENLGNFLVPLFIDCGSVSDACRAFGKLSFHTEHSWTSLMQGFNGIDQWQNAMDLYQQMIDENVCPSKFTFMALLKACARLRHTRDGQDLHAEITIKGIENDPSVGNTLIDMYSKCGMPMKAKEIFDEFPSRDVILWNAHISSYVQVGQVREAFSSFARMVSEGISPNAITFLALLTSCSHAGLVEEGQIVVKYMHDVGRLTPTLEHYTCMVDLFSRAGHFYKAIALVEEMQVSDRLPLLLALLSACHKWANVELGKWAFEQSVQLNANCSAAYIGMANIYAAAGMQAQQAFKI